MKISYPVRDKDGKEFRSLAEIMRLVDGEAHGTWLLGGNGLWHGAVHISDVSNPYSALTPATLSSGKPVPLQFMADGTIAAYRINNDYLKGPYKGQELRYSSTFVLVKSLCQPDPQKEKSWLEFYSLYMHLAPVKDYPASPCYKVRVGHSGILLRTYADGINGLPDGQESGDPVTYQAPPKTRKSLKAGDRFVSSRTGRFYVTKGRQSTLMTFGLVRLLTGEKMGDEEYWVTLDPELMEPDGEIQALMPTWMQNAKKNGIFDSVQMGGETEEWKVSAGTPAGFMGREEYPGSEGGQVEREWFVHLEVLSADPKMPAFLGNPAGVKGDKRTVLAPKGKVLYTRRTTDGQATFAATPAILDAQRVLPREATTPVTDETKQWWFNITGSGWLPEKNLAEAGQYDFLKLGFQPLEESSSGDMTKSPYEGWVPEAFDSVSRAAEQGDEWYEQVPPFYRELIAKMDVNHDGKVTEEEIRQALVVRDPLVRNVVNRLVVRHHSEWYGGRTTGRWEGFYKDLDAEEVAYCEKWQTDLEWMSGVSPFSNDEPVWHFHPVVFLDGINDSNYPKTPVDNELAPLVFLRFYNGEIIDDADFENAAKILECEVAAIKAVAKTETGNSGSYFKFEQKDDYVPAILFERHHFHKITNGVYDSHSDISNRRSGGYGRISEQYPKLLRAYALDKQAALKSASWGKFQILASNYEAAGYSSPEEFVRSISESEKNHLVAFVNFIKSNSKLLRAIRNKDWLNFALIYNGPNQDGYDERMRVNYEIYR
ncbi:N-acetylmuramidase domain-containing protein [Enterobacter sp. DTU_2021_1002640_1_SI_PRY_ASU_LCPMC_013]|uniref:N-acetylmuramidase domain-containing protein n=1 Tax=Enterobacter sp. DTU_2021_1002640_1_SI_PRY_ASU_LCPMC_013 TaxID=3077940 RepID=UPI0028E68B6E|nr:N-acetylmuramidase domain-containing protein [Enterobacter sp. DTU_2021_1002640_1_SI_PRY_ASU_LCPMC_013]WNU99844.1 N-acetylmuramidase domain-containing protein [Enterobacter sp. DTU_2021_1002640_1_SI_PRY_ASU_LCPMC_013]